MSRIPGIDPVLAEGNVAEALRDQVETWGDHLQPYLLLARRPSIFASVIGMWQALGQSGLVDSALATLINRRVASINGCVF